MHAQRRVIEEVVSERVDMGFYVLAQKAGDDKSPRKLSTIGETRQQKLAVLLRCPLDKSKVLIKGNYLHCEHNHQYPIHNGFPVMLEKNAISK